MKVSPTESSSRLIASRTASVNSSPLAYCHSWPHFVHPRTNRFHHAASSAVARGGWSARLNRSETPKMSSANPRKPHFALGCRPSNRSRRCLKPMVAFFLQWQLYSTATPAPRPASIVARGHASMACEQRRIRCGPYLLRVLRLGRWRDNSKTPGFFSFLVPDPPRQPCSQQEDGHRDELPRHRRKRSLESEGSPGMVPEPKEEEQMREKNETNAT